MKVVDLWGIRFVLNEEKFELENLKRHMSTGENINANGAILSEDMVRAGFFRFPQSYMAKVAPDVWPQVAAIQIAPGYPFKAAEDPDVPLGEVWFVGIDGVQLGRIVNVGQHTATAVTQNDQMDFIDSEYQGGEEKTHKQKKRRVSDSLH